MEKKYDIFISYRREGGADKARQLESEFRGRHYDVFLDFDELKDGKFDRSIESAIKNAPIFVLILTPGALDRCKEVDDWVRKEIECAITSKCKIIPVQFDNCFDIPSDLPSHIREGIEGHQFSEINTRSHYRKTVDELVEIRIAPVLEKAITVEEPPSETPDYEINDDLELIPDENEEGKWGFLDYNDNIFIPYKYTCASYFTEGLARVARAGKWGFIDKHGKSIIKFKYDFAFDFSEGVAAVRMGDRWGYIDSKEKLIIPFIYDEAFSFSDGIASVYLKRKRILIDKCGNVVDENL